MVSFRPGEELSLPALARVQGFASDVFTVVDVIRGGMGVCARVRQTPSGPSFALKALPEGKGSKEDFERFLGELQVWLTLSVCDGIVEALCVFPLDKRPVVCSRWMAGGSLRSQMSSRNLDIFYRAIVRIAGALEWASAEHHIVHRDLKPENILLDDQGRAAVSDWGISAPLGESELEATPEGGHLIFGTAAYASPEQLLGGVPLDLRSDIYSLGCLMYEWETGRKPFSGTWHEIREAKIRGEPPKIASGIFRKTSFGAESVITRSLQRERHDRYADWKSFVGDLTMAAARRGITVAPFVPRMRYHAAARGAAALKARVAGGAVVTGRGEGRASVDVGRATRDLEEARKLSESGDWKGAVELLSRMVLPSVVRGLPDDPVQQGAVLILARGLITLGRPAEAVTVLDALSEATEKPVELFTLLTEAHLLLSHGSVAERLARAGLIVHAGNTTLLERLVEAQRAQGLFSAAVATARQRLGVARDPAALATAGEQLVAYAAHVPEARLYESFAPLHEAIALLQEARERAPLDSFWRLPLARALAALERWPEARVVLEGLAAETRDPRRACEASEVLAHCLLRLREYAACLAQCNRSLLLFPESGILARMRAVAFAEGFVLGVETDGRRVTDDAAMGFFERIVGDEQNRRPVDFTILARYREWTGRAAEGIALLLEGRKVFPESWEIAVAQAGQLERRGAFEEALTAAGEAVRLAPFRPEGWRALAAVRGILGPKTEAEEARQKAAQTKRRLRDLRAKAPVK